MVRRNAWTSVGFVLFRHPCVWPAQIQYCCETDEATYKQFAHCPQHIHSLMWWIKMIFFTQSLSLSPSPHCYIFTFIRCVRRSPQTVFVHKMSNNASLAGEGWYWAAAQRWRQRPAAAIGRCRQLGGVCSMRPGSRCVCVWVWGIRARHDSPTESTDNIFMFAHTISLTFSFATAMAFFCTSFLCIFISSLVEGRFWFWYNIANHDGEWKYMFHNSIACIGYGRWWWNVCVCGRVRCA